jgi:hypothetical protein
MSEEKKQDDLVVLFPTVDQLKAKALEYIPKLKTANVKAVMQMEQWLEGGDLQDDEERQQLNDFLAGIRSSGQKMQALRKEITLPIDAAVSELIALEKPLMDDKNSLYSQLRTLITKYDQAKLDEKLRLEKEAADRKAREIALIEIKAVILKNLHNLATTKAKNAEAWAKTWWEQTTLETWDARADAFMKIRPNLKREEYETMFTINYADKIKAAMFQDQPYALTTYIDELKKTETYEKWNKEVLDASMPIINEWRGKIPSMKEERIRINQIQDEQLKQQAIRDAKAKEEAEEERRSRDIEQQAVHKSLQVDGIAALDKLESSFAEQATVQGAPDAGLFKLVLRFENVAKAYQPFVTIIYHVMASKKFQGIVKRDAKLGTPIVDEKGNPEYIPQVQWWIDQFLKDVNADVPGTKVFQVAKTIVRKTP